MWQANSARTVLDRLIPITEGEFAGWHTWPDIGPYERSSGPYALRQEATGVMRCAFRAGPQHLNGGGTVHGGCLATFADFALAAIAAQEIDGAAVTITLTTTFLAPVNAGDLIEASGRVLRDRRLIFVHGGAEADGRAVLDFSGILRKL